MTKPRYTPTPVAPPEVAARYQAVLETVSGKLTVTEAARRLGLPRNHFQSLMNRGLQALLEAVTPGRPGRPPKPEREAALEAEVHRLQRENERLRQRAGSVDRLLGLVSEVARARVKTSPRAASTKAVTEAPPSDSDEEPAGTADARMRESDALMHLGVPAEWAAKAVGASSSTLRRWRARSREGAPLCRTRGPGPRGGPLPSARTEATAKLRELNGLIGAAALANAVGGLSRRDAAGIKEEVLRQLERERVAGAVRVVVPTPGVVRGFDAMHVQTAAGPQYILVSGDAAVPFRTQLCVVWAYDERAVARALAEDFETNGPPLVLRLDRAKAHRAPCVLEVLAHHRVLALSGPPRCARYYGQLERQNGEQRQWLSPAGLVAACQSMRRAFNEVLPRRSLGWRTSAAVWNSRVEPVVDRLALHEEVHDRTRRLWEAGDARMRNAGVAERFAIEAALTQRGLLAQVRGGWC